MTTRLALLGLAAVLTAGPALAQTATTEPQADTMAPAEPTAPDATAQAGAEPATTTSGPVTLSGIIGAIESEDRFGRITSIEWDDDGYWEVDYRREDGARIEIEIDAVTGEPWLEN